MYRVITYRSRKLKHSTVRLYEEDEVLSLSGEEPDGDDLSDDEPESKMSFRERRAQKKQLKAAQKETSKTYVIDGEDVDEEDLTEEERAEIKASQMINKDSFYDALEPLDSGEATKVKRKLSKETILIIGMIIICVVIGVVMIIGVSTMGGFGF